MERKTLVQGHIWTILSAGMISFLPSVLIWICMRMLGSDAAGMLSYAVAVSELPKTLVMFGARNFQATDVQYEYSLAVYFRLRVYTVMAAIVGMVFFLLISDFDLNKVAIVAFWALYIMTDASSDVFEGELQRKSKMYLAGRIRFIRAFVAGISFFVLLWITKYLSGSLAVMLVIAIGISMIGIWITRKNFGAVFSHVDWGAIKPLLFACLPIFLTQFLSQVLINLPKYLLPSLRSDSELAIYTLIQTPAFFINLFSFFVFFGPELTKAAGYYKERELDRLTKRIGVQLLFIAAVSILIIGFAFFIGLPLLSWMYDIDLMGYKLPFMVAMFGGCFTASCSLLGNVLVIVRRQKFYFFGYAGAVLLSLCTMPFIISHFGVAGAAWSGMMFFPLMTIYFLIVYTVVIKREKRAKEELR